MIALGLSGGMDLLHMKRPLFSPRNSYHDSAAALVDDGRVVRAIEEERLNRIKHTNKAAVSAIRFCLQSYGIRFSDVDVLVAYGREDHIDALLRRAYLLDVSNPAVSSARELVHETLRAGLDEDIDDAKLVFVPHHLAHAISAYYMSGLSDSLVLTLDGEGDDISGTVFDGCGDDLTMIRGFALPKSLGHFYLAAVRFIGFDFFDEYKVMALAPYGDPSKYRSSFSDLYTLLPDGDYKISREYYSSLYRLAAPRRIGEPLAQIHMDIAAALQEALESIVLHIVNHYRKVVSSRNLCMAGGVAHNCVLAGKILRSGLFDHVFVQPASHDGGCALGAAMYPFVQNSSKISVAASRLEHVYLGTDINEGKTSSELTSQEVWKDFIKLEGRLTSEGVARLMAEGHVVGWVQGRAEFGPRALGNRSILADPRPSSNKDLINELVKKREHYRPFAPVVLEEYVEEYFEVPSTQRQFPFMVFAVNVRPDKRALLGAVTHVDGTARVQTVNRKTNEALWDLIDAFRQQTGVPILLNTSFNNNVEPIVNTVDEAIVCLLTTGLQYLVVGDCVFRKKDWDLACCGGLIPSLPAYVRLVQSRETRSDGSLATGWRLTHTGGRDDARISANTFKVFSEIDGVKTFNQLFTAAGFQHSAKKSATLEEAVNLWSSRLIIMRPSSL